MNRASRKPKQSKKELLGRIAECEETLRAIRSGEVDAVVVSGPRGDQVYSLREAEHVYRVMVESMSEGACTLSADGVVLYANAQLADLFEVPLEQVIGRRLTQVVEIDDSRSYAVLLENGLRERGTAELSFRCCSGSRRYAYFSSRRLAMESFRGLCLLITDLTALKQNQSQLAAVERELGETRRLSDIGALAATVAHELRNPLAAIGVASKNLDAKVENGVGERQFATIKRKIIESDQIINNLLFYSRLKSPHREMVHITEIIQEVGELAKKKYAKNFKFRFKAGSFRDAAVMGDPLQLRELFYNVINNACEALPPQGGEVEVGFSGSGSLLKVAVRDNGEGMTPEQIQRATEPFYTTKSKGTGLGLAVSQEIVKLHRGRLEITSRPKDGTQVCVFLPMMKKPEKGSHEQTDPDRG